MCTTHFAIRCVSIIPENMENLGFYFGQATYFSAFSEEMELHYLVNTAVWKCQTHQPALLSQVASSGTINVRSFFLE